MTKERRKKREIKQIPIDLLVDPPKPLRTEMIREELESLAASLKEVGCIHPLIVKPQGEKFQVVTGQRRFWAAKMAGLASLPCVVLSLDEKDQAIIMGHENLIREDLSHLDVARYLRYLREECGLKREEIAEMFGKTPGWVDQRFMLLNSPPEIQEAVAAKQVDFYGGLLLGSIKEERERKRLLRQAIVGGASSRTIQGWVAQWKVEAGERERFPATSQVPEAQPTTPQMTFRCFWCRKVLPVDGMIIARFCSEDYSALLKALRISREEGESDEGSTDDQRLDGSSYLPPVEGEAKEGEETGEGLGNGEGREEE
jgi:ParB family chromosome partitioning protein